MLYTIFICTIYLLLTLSGMTLIKMGNTDSVGIHIPTLSIIISPKLLLGIMFYGMGFLTFVFFISKLKISVAIPVVSGIYCCFTVLIGYMIFNEKITLGQAIGIVMIIAGTVIVGVFK